MNKLVAVVALCFLANITFAAKLSRDDGAEGGSSGSGSVPDMGSFMSQFQGIMEQVQAGGSGGGAENEEGSSGSGGMFGMLGAMPSGIPEIPAGMPSGIPEIPAGMPSGIPALPGMGGGESS